MSSDNKQWYIHTKGKPYGPVSADEIRRGIKSGIYNEKMMAFGPGMIKWESILTIPQLRISSPKTTDSAHIPSPTFHQDLLAHDIDFEIMGDDSQLVQIELDPTESVISEAGNMMYMDAPVQMDTVFGDGNENRGIVDSLIGAGKRLLTGESLFMTVFTNRGHDKHHVAFSGPYPGKIIPMNLAELGNELVCQKSAFLCAAKGISVSIAFQKRIGVGLFGGEGFIMQKLEGDGLAFVHAGGMIVNRKLKAGEQLKVDSGCIVALEKTIDYDIQFVGGIKSALFGGEGFFFAQLTGPGNVWLQSLPFSRLAGKLAQVLPPARGKGEGSMLGGASGIGGIFER